MGTKVSNKHHNLEIWTCYKLFLIILIILISKTLKMTQKLKYWLVFFFNRDDLFNCWFNNDIFALVTIRLQYSFKISISCLSLLVKKQLVLIKNNPRIIWCSLKQISCVTSIKISFVCHARGLKSIVCFYYQIISPCF